MDLRDGKGRCAAPVPYARAKKCLFAFALLLGCGKSAEQTVEDGGTDALDPAVESGAVACPTDPPMAGTSCVGTGSCTYRCGCGYTMTASCKGARWSTTYCPSPTELCRDGGACPVDPPTVGEPCEGSQRCRYSCSPCAGDYEATCVDGAWAGVACCRAPTDVGICTMNGDGSWARSCSGESGCEIREVTSDATTGQPVVLGACLEGCARDADCPSGALCQTETTRCVKSKVTYPRKLGEACTSSADCACLLDPSTKTGVCADVCVFASPCAPGYTCDPRLPSGGFTAVGEPRLLGNCLRDCTADADCTAPSRCIEHAVIGHKTCSIER